MRRKKTLLRRLWALVVAIVLLLAALDVYSESYHILPFGKGFVLTRLRRMGIQAGFDGAKFGIIRGLVIDNLIISDGQLPDHELLRATQFRADVGLFGKLKRFELEGGQIDIPLKRHDRSGLHKLRLSAINAKGTISKEQDKSWADINLTARVNEQIELDLTFQGALPPKGPDEDKPVFSVVPLFARIPDELLQAIETLNDIAMSCGPDTSIRIVSQLKADLGKAAVVDFNTRVSITNLFYNGTVIDQLNAVVQLRGDQLSIKDLRLQIEKSENLQGNLTFDLEKRIIECAFSGQLFPKKLCRAFAPEVLAQLKPIDFEGTPPHFRLTMHPTPIDQIDKAHVELQLNIRDTRIFDGHVRYAQGAAVYRDGLLELTNVSANLSGNVDIRGGMYWDIPRKTVLIRASQDGPPTAFCDFVRLKPLRDAMATVFKSFKFSPLALPRADADVFIEGVGTKNPRVFLSADVGMNAFSYNGVDVDSMRSSFFVDVPGRVVVIDRLHIRRDGAPAGAQIVVNFDKKSPELSFNIASNLESSALMQLVWKDWHSILTNIGFRFEQTPYAESSGRVSLADPKDHHFILHVDTDNVHFGPVFGRNVKAELDFKWNKIVGNGRASNLKLYGFTFENSRATDFSFTPQAVRTKAQSKSASIAGVRFGSNSGVVVFENKKLRVEDVHCDDMIVKTSDFSIRFNEIRSPLISVSEKGEVQASGTAEAAEYQLGGGTILARAQKLDASRLSWRDNQFNVKGRMGNIKYLPLKASATGATFESVLGGDKSLARIVVPQFKAPNGIELKNIGVVTSSDKGETLASFTLDEVKYRGVTGKKLKGRMSHEGKSYQLTDVACDELRFQQFLLTQLKGNAIIAFNTLSMRLGAGLLSILPKHKLTRKGEIRYPMDVTRVQAALHYQKDELDIRNLRGDFYGGTLEAQARSRFKDNETKLEFKLGGVDLKEFVQRGKTKKDKDSEVDGQLSAGASVYLIHEGDDVNIYGSGNAQLRKGTLWKVPLLSDFLSLLKTKFGKITKLDCEYRFSGERVDLTHLKTDGKVVSVQANGYYWWKTEGVDIRLEASLFRLGIFKSLLARRMLGSLDDYVWEKLSALKDLFRDTKTPVDPTTQQDWIERQEELKKERAKKAKKGEKRERPPKQPGPEADEK